MRRRLLATIEIATSFVVAIVFVLACANIKVDPVERMGQVSGIATVELRFLLFALPMLAALALAAKLRGGAAFATTSRFVCAALAGLAGATVAAGILVALRDTPFGLGGTSGDAGTLCSWADGIKRGDTDFSPAYPPLQIYALAWLSDLLHEPTAHAMKAFQIVGLTAVGPLAYSAWRLIARPGWALGLGVVAALTLMEPYRPYPLLVLVVFLPLLIRFLQIVRRAGQQSIPRLLTCAVLFGLAFGGLFLLYSGWYQWSAPGFLVAVAIVFPWRTGWRRGVLFGAVAGLVFALLTVRYLNGVVAVAGVKDNFIYFDAQVEPTYIAMWRGGLPGAIGTWPPLGELGGVGVFSIVMMIGLGASLMLGHARTAVIGVGSIFAGTWLFRLWHAHHMWQTKLVQLYPRTTPELLYCLLILCAVTVYLLVERTAATSPVRSPWALFGVAACLIMLIMSSSSATIDRYMPKNVDGDPGQLAWIAQHLSRREPSRAHDATVVTSSALDAAGWSPRALVDGNLDTAYSSALGRTDDHEESIELHLPENRRFSRVVLYPAVDGFPIDFAIESWNGTAWVQRRMIVNAPAPYGGAIYELGGVDLTAAVRIRATKLRTVGDADGPGADHVLRLAEIELEP